MFDPLGIYKFNYSNPEQLILVLEQLHILTPSVYAYLSKINRTKIEPAYKIRNSLITGALYDQLQENKSREIILQKLRNSNYNFRNIETLSKQYLQGEIELTDLILDIDFMYSLNGLVSKLSNNVESEVQAFVDFAFADQGILNKVELMDSIILVKVGQLSYCLKSDSLRRILKNKINSFQKCEQLYQSLIPLLNQISVDHGLNLVFGLYVGNTLLASPPFDFVDPPFDYLTNEFKVLALQKFTAPKQSSIYNINISPFVNPVGCHGNTSLRWLKIRGENTTQKHISTNRKIQYINYILPDTISTDDSLFFIQNSFYPSDISTMLTLISDYHTYIDVMANFSSLCKNEDNCIGSVQEKMPYLFKIFKQNIDIDILSINANNIEYNYNGEEYKPKTVNEFIRNIENLLKDEGSKKSLWRLPVIWDGKIHIWYLDNDEKNQLEQLLDQNFIRF